MSTSSKKSVNILLVLLLVAFLSMDGINGAKRLFRNRMTPEELRKPFVLLYEHESFRGKEVIQYISKACLNLPKEYRDWASSVDTHRTCASVCISENCAGPCHNVYTNQGLSKLRLIGYNDKIRSVKTCF